MGAQRLAAPHRVLVLPLEKGVPAVPGGICPEAEGFLLLRGLPVAIHLCRHCSIPRILFYKRSSINRDHKLIQHGPIPVFKEKEKSLVEVYEIFDIFRKPCGRISLSLSTSGRSARSR